MLMPSNMDSIPVPDKAQGALLSVRDAAGYLKMSEGWLSQSDIPFVRLGRSRRYRLVDLDSHIEQNLSHRPNRGPR